MSAPTRTSSRIMPGSPIATLYVKSIGSRGLSRRDRCCWSADGNWKSGGLLMVRMAVIVLGVLLSLPANAQSLRLKNYLNPENDRIREFNEIYLAGAMDALTAYNMAAPVKL